MAEMNYNADRAGRLERLVMTFPPEHLIVTAHPPKPTTGMRTGMEPNGVRIVHTPTGCAVECVKFRSQHQNKQSALAVLELLVDA